MEHFLQAVKSRSPTIPIHAAMTDDGKIVVYIILVNAIYPQNTIHIDNTGWCAIQAVFGSDVKHILCKWHVDQ